MIQQLINTISVTLIDLFSIHYLITFIIVLSILIYMTYNNNKMLSFFLLYVLFTFLLVLNFIKFTTFLTQSVYTYYLAIFFSYHVYFTITRRYTFKLFIIVRSYIKQAKYFILFLWFFFVFLTSLIGTDFIIVFVLNPIMLVFIVKKNYILLIFLQTLLSWTFILYYCNYYNMNIFFLKKIQSFFSRSACLHLIGNNSGSKMVSRVSKGIPITVVGTTMFGCGVYVLDKECTTGNFAYDKLFYYKQAHPNSTHLQQYKIYEEAYKGHANSSIVGRLLLNTEIIKPAAPEAVIPGYSTGLEEELIKINKK